MQSKARVRVSANPPAPKFLYSSTGHKALVSQSLHMQVTQCLSKPTIFAIHLSSLLTPALSTLGYSHTSYPNNSRDGSLFLRQVDIIWLCLFKSLWHLGGFVPRSFWEGSLKGWLAKCAGELFDKTVPGTI